MGRLIDADKLISYLNDLALSESPDDCESIEEREVSNVVYDTIQVCIMAVEEQQTAYDLDKVIEELGDKIELAYNRYMDCPYNSPCYVRYKTQYEERERCLEIVKGGGVDG